MEFEPGDYATRDGTPAKVFAKLPEPHLDGEAYAGCIKSHSAWEVAWWGDDGRFASSRQDPLDLLPPPSVLWCVFQNNCLVFSAASQVEAEETKAKMKKYYPSNSYRIISYAEVRQ